jgi:membrane protease subunit (stomatin/prohibitin family)
MGLLRGMARTAAVAGTATAVSNRVSRRQGQRWAAKDEEQESQSQSQQSAAPVEDDTYEQLEKLGELKDKGIITQAEFDAKKQQILGL